LRLLIALFRLFPPKFDALLNHVRIFQYRIILNNRNPHAFARHNHKYQNIIMLHFF